MVRAFGVAYAKREKKGRAWQTLDVFLTQVTLVKVECGFAEIVPMPVEIVEAGAEG
jgi:hypothetical protein